MQEQILNLQNQLNDYKEYIQLCDDAIIIINNVINNEEDKLKLIDLKFKLFDIKIQKEKKYKFMQRAEWEHENIIKVFNQQLYESKTNYKDLRKSGLELIHKNNININDKILINSICEQYQLGFNNDYDYVNSYFRLKNVLSKYIT